MCHLDVVVMAADILNALAGKFGNPFGMEHQLFHFLKAVFLVGQDVDDGPQFVFVQDFIVLLFSSTHHNESLRHGKESVHGWRVTIQLVENDITGTHQLLVFVERHILHLDDFEGMRMESLHTLQGTKHDVSTLVGMTTALDADEETNGCPSLVRSLRGDSGDIDGKRDKMGFVGEMRTIAAIVLIESCDNGICIGCHIFVDGCLLAIEPVADKLLVERFLHALVGTDVEVGIAESSTVEAGLHPVMVHTERAQHQTLVMTTDEAVERLDFVGTQIEENGIDKLHHVVIPELRHGTQDVEKITERVHLPQRPSA